MNQHLPLAAVSLLTGMVFIPPPQSAFAGDYSVKVIATGLDNPRGLAFSPLGALYVAEAGWGGDGPCIEGPDGAYYVGELTGFPFEPGAARVYRVVPGENPEIFEDGFTNIIDLAFGSDGSLYVLEYSRNGLLSGDLTGALIRIAPDGTREEIASEGLFTPAGLAIDAHDRLYVSNDGGFPEEGEVLKLTWND